MRRNNVNEKNRHLQAGLGKAEPKSVRVYFSPSTREEIFLTILFLDLFFRRTVFVCNKAGSDSKVNRFVDNVYSLETKRLQENCNPAGN